MQATSRSREDPSKGANAVAAAQECTMSFRRAAGVYFMLVGSILKSLKRVVSMHATKGASTVLTRKQEEKLVDALLWAVRHDLFSGR